MKGFCAIWLIAAVSALVSAGEPISKLEIDQFYKERAAAGLPPRMPLLAFGSAMKTGHVGIVPNGQLGLEFNEFVRCRVEQVMPDSILASVEIYGWRTRFSSVGVHARPRGNEPVLRDTTRVLVKRISTKDLVDGKSVALPGAFEVKGTQRLDTNLGEMTVFVLEPTELPAPPANVVAEAKDKGLRTWKSKAGDFSVEAEFIDFAEGKIVLKKVDGGEIRVSPSKLTAEDQKYYREELKRRKKK